jgi:hypothetical protein
MVGRHIWTNDRQRRQVLANGSDDETTDRSVDVTTARTMSDGIEAGRTMSDGIESARAHERVHS